MLPIAYLGWLEWKARSRRNRGWEPDTMTKPMHFSLVPILSLLSSARGTQETKAVVESTARAGFKKGREAGRNWMGLAVSHLPKWIFSSPVQL